MGARSKKKTWNKYCKRCGKVYTCYGKYCRVCEDCKITYNGMKIGRTPGSINKKED